MTDARIFKNFGALSFDGKRVTGDGAPASNDFQKQGTLASVQDFNVHQDSAAEKRLPQPEDSRATRQLTKTVLPPYRHWGINE